MIVRRDLPIGLLAAQIVHAADESIDGFVTSGMHAVVLTVPSETALLAVSANLMSARIAHVRIEEPDAPYNGALMALGLRPMKKEVLKRYLSSLPLLK